MMSKTNEGRKTSCEVKQQQQPTSQLPPGGSPQASTITGSFVEFTKVS